MTKKTESKNKEESKKSAEEGPITKEMGIGQIAQEYPESLEVFGKFGMHCIGCAAAHFENLEQGCEAHGIDAEKLVKALNKAVSSDNSKTESSEETDE